ncbi:MAG: quinone-dependent dihydroorotate dehydrogenase [Beijerinckiaceae bacterium]|jgi:dihydroorotate dehydrogenase|nr:quinone-dependent dihydroorotate dehydrogenase [Beijerinckiaceae bacterium]
MFARAFPLLRPLIGSIDAEQAHELAVRALEIMPLPTCGPDDPRLEMEVFGLKFPNPVGMAAGFDKDGRVPDPVLRLGFGFVEIGGVTRNPQPGNPRPRVFRLQPDDAVINRYGLNSAGMNAVKARLEKRRGKGILGINLGANKDSTDRIGDYVSLIETLGAHADFVTLNISSPNTPGLRDLQGRAFLEELLDRSLEARARAGLSTRILLKIAPDLDDLQLDDIVEVARSHRIDGMIVSNTTIARAGLKDKAQAQEAGGLSGKPLFRPSTVKLAKTWLRVEGQFPLIGVGGIASGADALAKIEAGASLVQLYTALIYQGPALLQEIKQTLAAAAPPEGLSAIVGRAARDWASSAC